MLNKELLQMALDALEDAVGLHVRWDDAHAETITALRSALAAPQRPRSTRRQDLTLGELK